MTSSLIPVPQPPLSVRVRARLNVDPRAWGVQAIAEMGVAVALAAVLGMVRVWTMPQGGSVSLEMLPILFVAIRRGLGPGVVVGAVYGVVQLLLGAYIYYPLQVVLDYPLAFAAVGLAGLVPVRPTTVTVAGPVGRSGWFGGVLRGITALVPAVLLGTGARFVFHFLSGVIFFATYAPAGWPAWLYSVTYNALYLVPEAIISAIVLWPLLTAYDAAFGAPGAAAGRR